MGKKKLPKGLKRADALRIMRRKQKEDFRGFTYDPKTGKAQTT